MEENPFYVMTVGLEGQKLVEASAGTGKTYSIAILVLRMLLERGFSMDKILMVTFTIAAASELETRIRRFVRKGYRYVSGRENLPENDNIRLVIENSPGTKVQKREKLKDAVQKLDELSVMTIHSFCQSAINEFTFETGQPFDFEIITDDFQLLENQANRYRREVLNILHEDTFRDLRLRLDLSGLQQLLKKHLQGMRFADYVIDETVDYEILKERINEARVGLEEFVKGKFPQVSAMNGSNPIKKEAIAGNVSEFLRRFRDQLRTPAGYFDGFKFMKDEFIELENRIQQTERDFINYFFVDFFRHAEERLAIVKERNGYISYDDQIKSVWKALGNETLKKRLSEKYQAVFIDEFQDTDRFQYKIFSTLFPGQGAGETETVVFYIGDPKQSIYGWRGADLDTYKEARQNVDNGVYTMNTNYRSTSNMIEALNNLLGGQDHFNLFLDDEITYNKVEAGAIAPGEMTIDGREVVPVSIWKFRNNDNGTSFRMVASEILRLLSGNARINGAKIVPGDIGVLVRDNWEGDQIKELLAQYNIPSVKRDDAKVLESEEAVMIRHLLRAVVSPNRGSINRALLSPWFGFNHETIKTLDDETHINIFVGLMKKLTDEGIYQMISSFLTTYGVRAICRDDVMGQRVLTNIIQISEILHKVERQMRYTPEELLVWMNRSSKESNEEYIQRIESDEDAVQISTIHKAKGLEYNIVFAPGLCMIPKENRLQRNNVNDFRKDNEYWFTFNYPDLPDEDKALHDLQKEQENRRLIYVALTRAVYKCYISYMPRSYKRSPRKSSMDDLVERIPGINPELVEEIDLTAMRTVHTDGRYHPGEGPIQVFSPRQLELNEIEIKNTFGIHSFSALSRAHHAAPFVKEEIEGEGLRYDRFVFQELGRGAKVGTALHSIFERLNFEDETTWGQTILDASKYYPYIIHDRIEGKDIESNLGYIKQLVENVMKARIGINGELFTLSDVKSKEKLPELEFYFPITNVNRKVIDKYLGEEAHLGGESDIEGLMTGYIDLVFNHNGKYYILDWKSNHLGNNTACYDQQGMEEAMTGSNYHLQYLIYTVALKRWLEQRLENFDFDSDFGGIIYVFLRGVRTGLNTGFYIKKPDMKDIKNLDDALRGQEPKT